MDEGSDKMSKPKLIVYTTNIYTRADIEAMADAGAMLACHIGPSEDYMIDWFMGCDIPGNQRIWMTTFFDKSDTLESITDGCAISDRMFRRKLPLAKLPGFAGIDFEPTGDDLRRYKIEPLPLQAYLNLRRMVRDFAASWDFSMPAESRFSCLYNAFSDVGVWKISQWSYFKSCGMIDVKEQRLKGRMPMECILGRMIANVTGYGGRALPLFDAIIGFDDEPILFIYGTRSSDTTVREDFHKIAMDIVNYLEKPC
jgi:hypothetical protein